MVNVGRKTGIDAEYALGRANEKFLSLIHIFASEIFSFVGNRERTEEILHSVYDVSAEKASLCTEVSLAEKRLIPSPEKSRKACSIYIAVSYTHLDVYKRQMQIDSVDTESTFTGVRVYLENTSEIESRNGLFVYSGDGTLVNVTVTGRKSVINSYTSDDIRVEADLSGVTAAGIYDIKLSARLPNGLTLSGMSADTIPVYVDERDKKTLEVKAKLVSGTVAEGYELGELSPKYDTITAVSYTHLKYAPSICLSLSLSKVKKPCLTASSNTAPRIAKTFAQA